MKQRKHHTNAIGPLGLGLASLLCASGAWAQTPAPATPAPAPPGPVAEPPAAPAPAAEAPPPVEATDEVAVGTEAAPHVEASAPAASEEAPAPGEAMVEPIASEAPPEAEEEAPSFGYKKGFFIKDGVNSLAIQARVQTRFTWELLDGGDDEANFSIARARVGLAGTTLTPALSYKFQFDLGKGNVSLKDFIVDYEFSPHFVLRTGQYKKPFSRQQITSSGSQELVDRAITDKAFGAGRDIGVMVHNKYEKSPGFEYALGLFNGTGDSTSITGSATVDALPAEGEPLDADVTVKGSNVPDVFKPALVARVGVNTADTKGYSEVDFEGGPLRVGAAASAIFDFNADNQGDDSMTRVGVDYILKASGFATTGGLYFGIPEGVDPTIGFHLQAGYLIADLVQPAVRFAMVDPDGDDNNTQELAFGVGVYPYKHNFKWQTDAALVTNQDPTGDTTDTVIRSQIQMAF